MAAITSAAIGGAGLLMSGYQAYKGNQAKRQGQKDLQNYERQSLDSQKANPYRNLQVSTVGSDAMREENQRTTANTVDALRSGGTRGIAMLPSVVAANNNANNEIRNYLDNQIINRNNLIAGDDVRLRAMMEARENADLAGIGNEIQVGRQDMWSGIRGMGNSAMALANSGVFDRSNAPVDATENQLKPVTTVKPTIVNNQITAPKIPSFLGQQPYAFGPQPYREIKPYSIVNSNYTL